MFFGSKNLLPSNRDQNCSEFGLSNLFSTLYSKIEQNNQSRPKWRKCLDRFNKKQRAKIQSRSQPLKEKRQKCL